MTGPAVPDDLLAESRAVTRYQSGVTTPEQYVAEIAATQPPPGPVWMSKCRRR